MQIQLGDQVIPLQEGPDGRFQASFQATEGLDHVLIPSDCIGTLHVDDIQLEEGAKATPYVEPESTQVKLAGSLKT
ncbi:Uncharacterised protein [Alloiococcus otitis]|uniref:hypothetical protein n=1 Tax=Alloiococcus otitis TaxID=1652 RepID=UPI000E151491|nr:hypothetical protein [Alloiococcus otitis]SUU91715.1 Uncharacterised protein [Alloiococcus otitis]